MTRVLVLGGSGALGAALLRELHKGGTQASFTYHGQPEAAKALSQELDYPAYASDFQDAEAIGLLFDALARDGRRPDAVVHCAGVAPVALIGEISAASWDAVNAVHARPAKLCAQQMERRG